jgi:hypothetical protein
LWGLVVGDGVLLGAARRVDALVAMVLGAIVAGVGCDVERCDCFLLVMWYVRSVVERGKRSCKGYLYFVVPTENTSH